MMSEELNAYLELMDLLLRHPFTTEIPLANTSNINIIEREKEGLQQLAEGNFVGKRRLLFGNSEISGGVRSDCIFEEELNEEQKCAVEYAVGVQDVYLIWGPPGTGKTTIVPEIVRNYIRLHKDNPKILVCSYTNRAVDNVVMKLFDDNRFKKIIVRFGYSTLTDNYKDALFDEQLKKKETEKEHKSKSKEAEKVEKDKEVTKSEINALTAEIAHIKELIAEKERSVLKSRLEDEVVRLDEELQEYQNNLKKLPIKKKGINEEIKEVEIHVSKLEDAKSDIDRQLAEWDKKAEDTANIIRIIATEYARRNKIVAHWKKCAFKRRNPLYEQYEQAITELQLARRNRIELERILHEKLKEQNKERERITKLQNELNEQEREIGEKKKKLSHKKEELKSVERIHVTILKEKQIIATTNLRIYTKLFESINFDLVIMDEAGAIDLPGAVLPFLRGNKFILLGDPEQLPPILVDRPPEIRR